MRGRLVTYLALCEELRVEQRQNGDRWTDRCRELNASAELQLATVERIVHRFDPQFAGQQLMPPSYSSFDHERVVRRALGALEDHSLVAAALEPDAPALAVDSLHPVIWRAAAVIWETGEFRIAVQQAAVALNAHIKKRAVSNLSESKLVQQVFSPEFPRKGQARLHLPGDMSDESWQSRQRGLHHLAQGAFAGIRNIATHEDVPWTESEALVPRSVVGRSALV